MSISLRPHWLQPTWLLCPWVFSRQEYWSGLPCPPPGFFATQGLNHISYISALAGGFFTTRSNMGNPRYSVYLDFFTPLCSLGTQVFTKWFVFWPPVCSKGPPASETQSLKVFSSQLSLKINWGQQWPWVKNVRMLYHWVNILGKYK